MNNSPSICFISGCNAGTTFEYRVLQKQEQLALFDIPTLVRQRLSYSERALREVLAYDVIFLYRVAYNPYIEELIEQARGRHIPVIFGVDDLVFEPTVVNDPVRTMPHHQAAHFYEGSWRYLQTLLAADFVVTATDYLADLARQHGKTAFVHRNGVSQWMIDAAERLIPQKTSDPQHVIIGYSSGTATHNQDFIEATPALAQLMSRHPEVELHILGPLAVPSELQPFGQRVRNLPLVPWKDVMDILNTFDINLAPLEYGNPFCHAKSEVKYIEAGVLGVPTVASRIDPFEFAIRDGENGYLAGDTEEWTEKLERLLVDPELRRSMGEAAHRDVMTQYTPAVLGERLVETFETIGERYAQEHVAVLDAAPEPNDVPLILNWIITEPTPGSGGHIDIIRMVNLLASFGHQINTYIVPRTRLTNRGDLYIREYIRHHFANIDGTVHKWASDYAMAEADGLFLTHWTTPYEVDDADDVTEVFYFVQDWEPFFNPMGTNYLRAEQTYKMGFSCITLGQWLTEYLREQYDADADYFDLAVDHEIYYPRPVEKPDHPRICFYARPSTPRRLFPMGMEALEIVHQRHPDVEIVFYGVRDEELSRFEIPFPYTNLGILKENELAALFSSSDLGIVLSSTNCSLVPPEMMACKCAVVDLNRDTVRGVLEHEVNALLAEPTPEAIAGAAVRLLEDEPLREQLVERAYEQVQRRSWIKSARRVEEIVCQKLPSTRRALAPRRFDLPFALPALADLPPEQGAHLDAIHRRRRGLIAQVKARVKNVARRLLRIDQSIGLNDVPIQMQGELRGRRTIGQQFVAQYDNLHRIDVLVATYGRRNTRDVIFHLKESPQSKEDLATVRLNVSLLLDRSYACFVFEPQPNSKGKSFYFYLESPESVPGDAISVWANPRDELKDPARYRDHHVRDGQIVFGAFYVREQIGEVGERPYSHGFSEVTTLWHRLTKAYHLLSGRNLSRLRWEIRQYLLWKLRRQ